VDLDGLVSRVAGIAGVETVMLGGSRAAGTESSTSDWDIGLYYRGSIDVDAVRAIGPGTVVAPGEWGRLMNGGGWLRVDGEPVDVLYRDLTAVEHWIDEAGAGRFDIDRLPGYLAGIPTYTLAAEVALGRHLAGRPLARPTFSDALREHAASVWRFNASFHLSYAETYAARGQRLLCLATVARAAIEEAHARVAERGEWHLNEKRVLAAAGLAGVDALTQVEDLSEVVSSAVALLGGPGAGTVSTAPRH
jgi:hypothetical protein